MPDNNVNPVLQGETLILDTETVDLEAYNFVGVICYVYFGNTILSVAMEEGEKISKVRSRNQIVDAIPINSIEEAEKRFEAAH